MRIALIAMSGIRVCDERLLELGLTLPGFVERSKAIASLPSLGLLTLAGMTPRRHEVEYIEIADFAQAPPIERAREFDLVAISSLTAQSLDAYALAGAIRATGTRVVIGGLHATCLPEEAARHADAVIIGEGEPVWNEVLRDAERNTLKPIYDARSAPYNMNHAPMPAFHLLDIDKYNRITIQTSRGCPYRCEFCASSILLTPRYKQKPIDRVLAELDRVCELWPRPFIEFADDNGFVNRPYWKRLLPEIARRNIRWFTETDITIAEDQEFLDLLARSGCAEVLIGLESPVPQGLPGLELLSDFKNRRGPGALDAVRAIQSHGVRVNGCFILGLDGQTPGVFDAVHDFAMDAGLFDVQITYATPFPGTPLHERLRRQGRLTHDGDWRRCTLFDLNFIPDPMTAEELTEGFYDLTRRLYSDECTRARRDRFVTMRRRSA
ncbi:MAG: B12-binding domain-containing radical SAM protein [Phycisphaeraceae bacterium]|nr:B12-binding domain-containing radical SAM protein [Phycisphaeraceae bacterium]MCB9848742.1 B12-binding domain-containing radical SAM protein [Phycisphaeraceae bacterium]